MFSPAFRRLARRLFRPGRRGTPPGPRPRLEALEDRLAPATIHWTNPAGGTWATPGNWGGGVVPGAADDAVIDVGGNVTVTHSVGNDTVHSLISQQNLTVTMSSRLTVTAGFTQGSNRALTVDQGATFSAGGATTLDGANLYASNGGTLGLPGATGYDGSVGVGSHELRADAGGHLDLSHVASWRGAGGPGDGNSAFVEAFTGGTVDLRLVPQISAGNSRFLARGTGSRLDLSALTRFAGAVAGGYSAVEATGGAAVAAASLASLDNVNVVIDGAGLPTRQIAALTRGSLYVGGGAPDFSGLASINALGLYVSNRAALALPQITAYDGSGGGGREFRVNGAGSLLDLSHVAAWRGAGGPGDGNSAFVEAFNGGAIDLRAVPQVTAGNTRFLARGAGSRLDLSALANFAGAVAGGYSAVEATAGGAVAAASLVSLDSVDVVIDGAGLPTRQIAALTRGSLYVSGGTPDFGGLTSINAMGISLSNGATLALPQITAYDASGPGNRVLQASGAGTRLDLSHLTAWRGAGGPGDGSAAFVVASGGGAVDLHLLPQIAGGNTRFQAGGANSRVDLSALTSFAGAVPAYSTIEPAQGGTIALNSGTTAVANGTVVLDATGTLTVGTLDLAPGAFLTGRGTLAANLIDDGQVSLPSASDAITVAGTATQTLGSVAGPGTLTVSGLLTWAGGAMSGTGVTNANGGLALTGSVAKTLDGRAFNNAAAATWTGSGDLVVGHGAAFNNLGTATFDVGTDQSILNQLGGTATFSNAGTFRKSAGAGTTTVAAVFTSTGPVEVSSGTLNLAGGGSCSGGVSNGATLAVGPGTTYAVSGPYSGTGTLSVAATARLNLTGSFDNLSGTTLTGGTYLVGGILQLPGTNIVTNAATVVLDGPNSQLVDQTGANALANLAANTAEGTFTVQNGRNFSTAGGFSNAGTLGVGAGSMLVVTGALANFAGTTLTDGTYFISGTFQFPGANIVTNAANLVLDGPTAQVLDKLGNNALANLAATGSTSDFTVLNGQTFTTPGDFFNGGTLTVMAGGTLTVSGRYSQTGTALVQAQGALVLAGGGSADGSFLNDGTLRVAPGITFTITGSFSETGTVVVPDTATLVLTGSFANFSGTTLTDGTYLIGGTLQFTGASLVTNAATLILDGPNARLVDELGNDALAALTANQGSFTIQNGRNFTPAGDLSNDGTLTVGAGSLFTVAGAYSQTGTLVVLAGGTMSLTGTFANFAAGTLTGGTYSIGGTFRFAGANLVTNAATVVLDGAAAAILDLLGNDALSGLAANQGSFTVQNGRNFTPVGAFSNDGILTVGAGSLFTVSGAYSQTGALIVLAGGTMSLTGTFTNFFGTTLTDGTYFLGGTFRFVGANVVTNAATIVLDGAAGTMVDEMGRDALANLAANAAAGSLTLQNGRVFTTAGDFRNAGSVTVGGGSSLVVRGAYTQGGGGTTLAGGALTASGLVDVQAGTLSGSGTVNASVRNGGELDVGGVGVAGRLTITGNYTQAAGGVLTLELGGPTAGTDYNQLVVGGQATLGGTLNVVLSNGYLPASGDQFRILTFGGRGTSTFATANLDPSLLPLVYDANDLTVVTR